MRELPVHAAMTRRRAFAITIAVTCVPWTVVAAMAGLRVLTDDAPLRRAFADVARDVLTLGLAQALATAIVLVASLREEAPESTARALFVRRVSPASLGVAAVVGLAMHLVLAEVANVVEAFIPQPLEQKLALARLLTPTDALSGVALVLALLVIAPVCEELVFRGLVEPRLALRTGRLEALCLSAALFGLAHAGGGLHAVVPATLAGALLAYVRRAQRSVLPAIAAHAASNAVPLLLPPSLVRLPGLNVVRDGPLHLHPLVVLCAALVTGVGLLHLARAPRDDDDDLA